MTGTYGRDEELCADCFDKFYKDTQLINVYP